MLEVLLVDISERHNNVKKMFIIRNKKNWGVQIQALSECWKYLTMNHPFCFCFLFGDDTGDATSVAPSNVV